MYLVSEEYISLYSFHLHCELTLENKFYIKRMLEMTSYTVYLMSNTGQGLSEGTRSIDILFITF